MRCASRTPSPPRSSSCRPIATWIPARGRGGSSTTSGGGATASTRGWWGRRNMPATRISGTAPPALAELRGQRAEVAADLVQQRPAGGPGLVIPLRGQRGGKLRLALQDDAV